MQSKGDALRTIEEEKDKQWPQILAIFTACLATVNCGMIYAWPSPFILAICRDKQRYDISEDEASNFTTIQPLGLIVASLALFKMTNVIGRRKCLLLIAVPHVAFWTTTIFAKSVKVFYIARFLGGIGDSVSLATLPMYIGEIAEAKVRGPWGNLMVCSVYCGQLFVNVSGSYLDVAQTAYVGLAVSIVFLATFSLMPESPYFYTTKGRYEAARNSLRFLRRKRNVQREFLQLKADVERQMSECPGTWKDLWSIASNRRAVAAAAFLRLFQQLAGMSVFTTYTQYIFQQSGGNLSPETSSIVFIALLFTFSFCSGFFLDKIGRRKTFLLSSFTCGVVLFVEATYFFLDQFHFNVDAFKWLPVTFMLVYVAFFSFGLGIVPTVMLSELFSSSVKEKAVCFLAVLYGCCIFATNYLFYWLDTAVGLFCPFLIFSLCCLFASALSFYLVPETKGKSLEEIQQSLKNSNKSNVNSTC